MRRVLPGTSADRARLRYPRRLPTTITGDVERVSYENEETSFRVIRVTVEGRASLPVVGVFAAVAPGARVRATGEIVVDPRHGRQLRADAVVPIAPETLAGLERYLAGGLIKGIGPVYAKRIVEKFGERTLDVLDKEPGRLREVPGLGAKRADEIRRTWTEKRAVNDLMVLLQSHGASPSLALRIHERYGDQAAAIVQRNPYRLAMDVRMVGFVTADRLARSLGISGDHPERVQAGVLHQIAAFADRGHTATARSDLVVATAAMLEVDEAHVHAAVDALWASGRVTLEGDAVYATWLFDAERSIAESLRTLLESPAEPLPGLALALEAFEAATRVELAPRQTEAVEAVAGKKVVVITGGPGVGKTTIVRAILAVLDGAKQRALLAAPTGRAAKRMSEATGRQASTIHRLLEFEPRTRVFQRNLRNPLDTDAIVVDEASMIDVPLAAALLEAVPPAARLVIVGDADQLPSVGPGAFLRDVITSKTTPTVRLDEIFRQADSSGIVRNAHRIFRGEPPESAAADDPRGDFFVIVRRDPAEAATTIRELVTRRIPQRFGLDPMRDVQVLVPMHRGPVGTTALNESLQAALNPTGSLFERRGQRYRSGDKVMQTKNDYERDVFNGDVGVIHAVDATARKLVVRFDGRLVEYEDAALDNLALAYAISIHKSQGSEYPAVVVPMLTSHFVMLSRNLLYTAVTRAKRLCCIVTHPRAIALALAETRRELRRTGLTARLLGAGS